MGNLDRLGIKLIILAGGLGIVVIILFGLTLMFPQGLLTTAAKQSDEYLQLQELQREYESREGLVSSKEQDREALSTGTGDAAGTRDTTDTAGTAGITGSADTAGIEHLLGDELAPDELPSDDLPSGLASAENQATGILDQIEGQQFIRLNLGIWYEEDYYNALAASLKGEEPIRVEGDKFLDTVVTAAAYARELRDRHVEVTGFLFEKPPATDTRTATETDLQEGDPKTVTLLGRISVTCCILDTEVYGFVLDPDTLPEHSFQTIRRVRSIADVPDEQLWVTVSGAIQGRGPGGAPILRVKTIGPGTPPETPFTYPRYYPKDAHLRPSDIELIQ